MTDHEFHFRGDRNNLDLLRREIDRALVIEPQEVSYDLVTMRSVLRVRDLQSDETQTLNLVYPWEADPELSIISVLDPLGLAVIGHKVGDIVIWDCPPGKKRLLIEELSYQPESLEQYYL